jgi:quinohemoprotein ethanol dehydrogenase
MKWLFWRRIFGVGIVVGSLASASGAETENGGNSGRVDAERLASSAREAGQWLTTGRDQGNTSYSPLSKINRQNVSQLGFAWEYDLGTQRGQESTPLVVDGVMYHVGNYGKVYAVDAGNGKEIWTYTPKFNGQLSRYEGNDIVSRGLVVWKGSIIALAPDCKLIALDAVKGTERWQVDTLDDDKKPYVCNGAPQLAGDVVVVGNAGGDVNPGGLRGYVSAFDVESGRFRWRFYTVPSLEEKNPSESMVRAAKTWDPKRDAKHGGGGAAWHSMTYDPSLGLIYVGTGNASPYLRPRDPGKSMDNLYAASIVALHAGSGEYAWHYQTTPGDRWDFDSTMTLVQADIEIKGQVRHVLMQANKNGYFYVLDRATGAPISAVPFAQVTWSSAMDRNFRPIVTENANYWAGPKLIYPSVQGAHSWPPMSYSPQTGLVYIPVLDAPNVMVDLERNPGATVKAFDQYTDGVAYVFPDKDYDPSAWTPLLGNLPKIPLTNSKTGKPLIRSYVKALDPVSGKIVWEHATSEGYLLLDGGTLATAGNLVFAGREDGTLIAYEARTGEILKTLSTGVAMMAAPMTYEVNGEQYVAVAEGHGGSYPGTFMDTAGMKYLNKNRLLAFKLGGASEISKPQLRADDPYREPPRATADPAKVAKGYRLFTVYCARCHSFGVPGVTPDLSKLRDGIENIETFQAIVLKGLFSSMGMPRFDDVLSPTDTDALHVYLVDEAWKGYKAQQSTAAAAKP